MTIRIDEYQGRGEDSTRTRAVPLTPQAALVDELPAYSARLLATARFLVRAEADAQDLVQATLEQAIRHIDELRDPAHLGGWLATIETREALRLRRRVGQALHLPSLLERPAAEPLDEVAVAIRQALSALPTRMRVALVLHHMVGLTVDETAAAMSITPNTARTHLKVGLKRLRETLE